MTALLEIADHRHPTKTTEKYTYVDSNAILQSLLDQRFDLEGRSWKKNPYGIHGAKLSHPDFPSLPDSEGRFQILMWNSHNGRGALSFRLGIYRFACANGILVGSDVAAIAFPHRGKIDNIIEGIWNVIENTDTVTHQVARMLETPMNSFDIRQFVEKCRSLRPMAEVQSGLPTLRPEDSDRNLWTVFNRAQETLIKGYYHTQSGRRARPITSFQRDTEINKKLWNIAEEFL